MERGGLHSQKPQPTAEEFEAARRRELARLNLRISSIKGHTCHTPQDEELLEGDTADRRLADVATVRRWSENSARHGGEPRRQRSQTSG